MPETRPARPARAQRLLVVANRLPVQRATARSEWVESTGGLVTALLPIVKQRRGVWVGWTGEEDATPPRPFVHEGVHIRPVGISGPEVEAFYNQFSNRTLWPLYHDAIRTPEFDHSWWRPYAVVNNRFAKAVAARAKRGDLVWIHDYHLQLVPMLLRRMRPDLRIGFFLHIPFPPEELFAWLPWRREVLQGLLGADVVGFQTYAAVQNFSRLARKFAGADGTDTQLEFEDRKVRVMSYPISIDFDWFDARARTPEAATQMRDIRRRVGQGRKILLCVDRLDYTKGIDLRLQAFESLLQSKRLTSEQCVLMQIAAPSREPVPEYDLMRTKIEQMVGRINGAFSEPGRVAVHYFRRGLAREELVGYYRAADVMVVTPVRDGMNLVCKEYVAARVDNTGVLVLSEFAGAARELRRALLVNPRDVQGLAGQMELALRLPPDDARQRMAVLRSTVRRHDVFDWARAFLEDLSA